MAESTKNTVNNTHHFNESEYDGIIEVLREAILNDPLGAIVMIDETSNAVHSGIAFSINASGTIAAGASVYLLGRTGAKEVHFDHFHIDVSKGFISMDLYEAPTVTADGTPIVGMNRKRNSTNTPTMATFSGTTVSANGTLMEETIIYGTGSLGSNTIAGTDSIDADWILAPNTEYLFVITNNDGTSTNFSGHFLWAERDVI